MSDKNTNVLAVQFVMKTEEIKMPGIKTEKKQLKKRVF